MVRDDAVQNIITDTVCNRSFGTNDTLNRHKRTHAEHKKYTYDAFNKFPDFFCRHLKIQYVIAIHLMR